MNTDERMKDLFARTYSGIHASDEYSRKVINMAEIKKSKVRTSMKIGAALAAAAILVVGGTVVSTASHKEYKGQYTTAYVNGEAVQARYGIWEKLNEYVVEADYDGYTYSAIIAGDYDEKTQPIYFKDVDNYVIASTDPEQELNLYEDIDKTDIAKIEDDMLITGSYFTDSPDSPCYNAVNLTYYDEIDGKTDGVLEFSRKERIAYVVTPEGFLVEGSKGKIHWTDFSKTLWGTIWGEEDMSALDAFVDSDGVIME